MNDNSELLLTDQDFERLALLVNQTGEAARALEEEISRAIIIRQKEAPRDLVTMNSVVAFADERNHERQVTLVYPKDADVTRMKISILAPIGTALIGLRLGQTIDWPMPNGKSKKLKVVSIPYQPEAEREWDL